MRRALLCAWVAWLLPGVLPVPPASAEGPERLPVAELIAGETAYDGRLVRIRGEAIGDMMLRGESGWFNLGDGTGTVGVHAPADLLARVVFLGRYNVTGDVLEVTGVFHSACGGHAGETHLEADDIRVLARGSAREETVNPGKLFLAVGLILLFLVAFLFRLYVRKAGGVRPG